MLGAIIGDIIGSIREGVKSQFNQEGHIVATIDQGEVTRLRKPEPILHAGLTFTDDTVLTLATESALRQGGSTPACYAAAYAAFFRQHATANERYRGPGIAFGPMFSEWAQHYLTSPSLAHDNTMQSFGNGSAMRASPIAYHHPRSLVNALNELRTSAQCTHDHPDGIEGAQAAGIAIWLARAGQTQDEIRHFIVTNFTYTLDFDLHTLIDEYEFDSSCPGSVPQAIWLALNGPDFETVMRNGLAIGGDTDTICAIAGAIAEPLYGIPESMARMALMVLERDGPFLFKEYQRAVKCNAEYPNYMTGLKAEKA